ncbi:MAG TPA: hypothetical protein VH518_06645 [Tepidisphaeraceae bacterium]|jgi:hypothetical protein
MTKQEAPPQPASPKAPSGGGAKKRHRSPSYPAISLDAALERAKTMFQHERKNAAALDVVMQHWGFKSKSSGGLLAAAAMKKFGLLDDVTGGKDRHVRLSPRALAIILDEQEDSPERDQHIRDAAMTPAAHVDLWNKYGAELPSEATLRTYLVRDKDFTDAAANQFIDEYKQTISFAGLISGDIIQNKNQDSGDKVDQQQSTPKSVPPVVTKPGATPSVPPKPSADQKDFPLYLSNQKRAVLYVPSSMTAKDYELLKKQIENHLMVIEATSVADEDQN